MAKKQREILVFIASPGDLAPERQVLRQKIEELNGGYGDGAGVELCPLGWEDTPATTGRRVQGVINADVDRCNVFVLALHRRWGQAAPDSEFSSYTEEEFYRALDRFEKTKAPEIWVFLRNVDRASLADPGPELAKVLEFRKKLEARHDTLMRTFSTETDFGQQMDKHLREFVEGRWDNLGGPAEIAVRPAAEALSLGQSENKAPVPTSPDLSLVKADKETLTLTSAALRAAQAGLAQDASILFAKATQGTTNLSVLAIATEFYRSIGDLETVNNLVRRQGAITRDRTLAARQYMSLMPEGFMKASFDQTVQQMLSRVPPEEADELRDIFEEAFGSGRLEEYMLGVLVRNYSDAELAAFSRFLGAPEGQSALQKQPVINQEMLEFGASEVERVLERRRALAVQDKNAGALENSPALPSGSVRELET